MLFQKRFIVSNNSLEQLLPYLIEKCSTINIDYVITNRLNQDILKPILKPRYIKKFFFFYEIE